MGSQAEIPGLLDVVALDVGRVAREALCGLRRHGVTDEVAQAAWDRATAPTTPSAGRRRIFVDVLALASRWVAAEVALKSLADADEGIRQLGADLLGRTATAWNRSSTAPAAGQLDALRQLLDEVEDRGSRRAREPPGGVPGHRRPVAVSGVGLPTQGRRLPPALVSRPDRRLPGYPAGVNVIGL
jgi:hypothetical protein